MMLHEEIHEFLTGEELDCKIVVREGHTILTCRKGSDRDSVIFPIVLTAGNISDADAASVSALDAITQIHEQKGEYPLIITEDRWRAQQEMMKARLLAHLEIFDHIYARNCEIRRIDKNTASDFLKANHSYGDAACRYRYGLFLKRHTGHIASEGKEAVRYPAGTLMAVATFSNARKWLKGGKTIRSYEWTRYASLPGVRLSGGMGKLLKAFIEDVKPDDIMTYADLEWSEGKVYERLGFVPEGQKSPVSFVVDTDNWTRHAIKSDGPWLPLTPVPAARCKGPLDHLLIRSRPLAGGDMSTPAIGPSDYRFHTNFGSKKYRLKLNDYQ